MLTEEIAEVGRMGGWDTSFHSPPYARATRTRAMVRIGKIRPIRPVCCLWT